MGREGLAEPPARENGRRAALFRRPSRGPAAALRRPPARVRAGPGSPARPSDLPDRPSRPCLSDRRPIALRADSRRYLCRLGPLRARARRRYRPSFSSPRALRRSTSFSPRPPARAALRLRWSIARRTRTPTPNAASKTSPTTAASGTRTAAWSPRSRSAARSPPGGLLHGQEPDAQHLNLLIDPRSEVSAGDEPWSDPESKLSWQTGTSRALAILSQQDLFEDLRRIEKDNSRLGWIDDLADELSPPAQEGSAGEAPRVHRGGDGRSSPRSARTSPSSAMTRRASRRWMHRGAPSLRPVGDGRPRRASRRCRST